jgi:hypothetical protein
VFGGNLARGGPVNHDRCRANAGFDHRLFADGEI